MKSTEVHHCPTITFWSQAGKDRHDTALLQPQENPAELAFAADSRFHAGRMQVPVTGTLVLQLLSPRPLRIWLGGARVLDEGLTWRSYERKLLAAVIFPCAKGELPFLVEVGPRSGWDPGMDNQCPSRNREYVRSELRKRLPDRLGLTATVTADVTGPAVSLRFLPSQYRQGDIAWPTYAEAKARLPVPVLPDQYAWMLKLYDYTWDVLFRLVRRPRPESGLPNPYVATAMQGFLHYQFVWDSSFTAMCTAYACRAMPYLATLDVLYSRQFDGGYIHREHDIRDGVPAACEPDFSPNPPIMTLVEWAIAGVTGDMERLAKVYAVLKDNHKWIEANRRLPGGIYWTTGLANGLDSSPSLGDGYPCLTSQMSHEAEVLGKISRVLGHDREADDWEAEHAATGKALNALLWCDAQQIYATSLSGGGHNPNKVVTAFWPLWAGIVPSERVEALAQHLKDPRSFWRHHPIPSLAADSPHFRPEGDYWRGSTWAPTNFAAIKGFDRAGRWTRHACRSGHTTVEVSLQ